jgi:hypothetical protein
MDARHMLHLGFALLIGASAAFVISWLLVSCLENPRAAVERTWFRCLAACFYAGLAVLLATALGSIIEHTVKGTK